VVVVAVVVLLLLLLLLLLGLVFICALSVWFVFFLPYK